MANKSAEKRARQSEKRRIRNHAIKSRVRTSIKKFQAAAASGDKELAAVTLKESLKLLDSAVGKGVLHRNNADRKKSRLQKIYNGLA